MIFIGFTIYFTVLLIALFPFLKSHLGLDPALCWFITGYFLFIPLFVFPIVSVRAEGGKGLAQLGRALHVMPLSKRDFRYTIAGLIITCASTGVIFAASYFLSRSLGIGLIDTTPWFMEMKPLQGLDRLFLLVWAPMFFFNIFGEELLWRGYIQARLPRRRAWILCSFLWLLFHLPFGIDLLIILLPVIIVIPYVFSRTGNTSVGILIHGLFNGPIFIAVALGLIH